MKDIDLTKCNNCRFRAKVDEKEIVGKIEKPKTSILLTGDDMYGCVVSPTEMDNLLRGVDLTTEDGNFYITDFEIVPRDPETYRDWQVGDRVHYPNGDNDIVIFRSGELVVLADDFTEENSDVTAVNTCSQLFDRREGRLVLTDIEQQIIEKKKKYEPQDGDIVAWKDKEDDGDSAVSIYKANHRSYITLFTTGSCYVPEGTLAMEIVRPATEDEKQRLFDAMAKKGKRWNAEKKVVEDIPKPYEFKKGEPVLAREWIEDKWELFAFLYMPEMGRGSYGLTRTGKDLYERAFCLPYNERTMHLLGTTENYKEE